MVLGLVMWLSEYNSKQHLASDKYFAATNLKNRMILISLLALKKMKDLSTIKERKTNISSLKGLKGSIKINLKYY